MIRKLLAAVAISALTAGAVFAGEGDVVAKMIEMCRQGPYGAHVSGIDQRPGTSDDLAMRRTGEEFSVLPTV